MRSEHECLRWYNDWTNEVVTKRTPRGFTISGPTAYPGTHTHPKIRPIPIVGEHHQPGARACILERYGTGEHIRLPGILQDSLPYDRVPSYSRALTLIRTASRSPPGTLGA